MLFILPVHSKPFSAFSCSVALLSAFHTLYEPFKAFLCLPVDVRKVGVDPAACKKINVCNPCCTVSNSPSAAAPRYLLAVLLRQIKLYMESDNHLVFRICRPVPQKSSLPLSVSSIFYFI